MTEYTLHGNCLLWKSAMARAHLVRECTPTQTSHMVGSDRTEATFRFDDTLSQSALQLCYIHVIVYTLINFNQPQRKKGAPPYPRARYFL